MRNTKQTDAFQGKKKQNVQGKLEHFDAVNMNFTHFLLQLECESIMAENRIPNYIER